MNSTQDMILSIQTQLVANLRGGGAKKPEAQRPEDGKSFQDLLNQRTQASGKEPQRSETVEQPSSPDAPTQEEQVLDPYRQQLMAAAQLAAMAAPVVTAEPVPQETEQGIQLQQVEALAAPQAATAQTAEQPVETLEAAAPQSPVARTDEAPQTREPQPHAPTEQQPEPLQKPVEAKESTQHQAPETQVETGAPKAQARSAYNQDAEVVDAVAQSPQQPLFQGVETAPIKVADAPVLDTQAPDMEAQLARQVETLLDKGGDRVELKLTPGNLGTVTVQLTKGQDGSLHVALGAGGEKAAAILEKHVAGLESALLATNRAPVQVEVQRGQEGQQAQSDQRQQTYDREGGGRHQQQERQPQREHGQDFLQQLRLGLVPAAEAS